jgi:hypothetical protein
MSSWLSYQFISGRLDQIFQPSYYRCRCPLHPPRVTLKNSGLFVLFKMHVSQYILHVFYRLVTWVALATLVHFVTRVRPPRPLGWTP